VEAGLSGEYPYIFVLLFTATFKNSDLAATVDDQKAFVMVLAFKHLHERAQLLHSPLFGSLLKASTLDSWPHGVKL
jgi:hypothetical protein